ncbi:MAG: DUF2808 domain-containing protein [Kamptonema sp. SIO4C4]|nr:DUF2808 domain-containing protein [Kamptonema sp. SIO4C4]
MRNLSCTVLTCTLLTGMAAMPSTTLAQPSDIQFPDNIPRFIGSPPSLDSLQTTNSDAYSRYAKYYLTLTHPDTAEIPLQRVTIQQRGGTEWINLQEEETTAFVGTRRNQGEIIPIAEVHQNRDNQTLEVIFARPISPGTTVSIKLHPLHNPRWSGAYTFGITVFPAGEQAQGLYLGSRRLHFYERFRRF